MSDIDIVKIAVAKEGECLTAKQHGDIVIKVDGDSSNKTMKNVFFIEKLKCNLMSISKLVSNGYKVEFIGQKAYISKNNKIIFGARLNGKLYEVVFHLDNNLFAEYTGEKILQNISQNLWHFRLGHLNIHDMKKMVVHNMVVGLDKLDVNTSKNFCESCTYGKQTRLPFHKNKNLRSSKILEMIHTDVCGQMSQQAWDGSKYFLTFTDDFSRATKVYCIQRKS